MCLILNFGSVSSFSWPLICWTEAFLVSERYSRIIIDFNYVFWRKRDHWDEQGNSMIESESLEEPVDFRKRVVPAKSSRKLCQGLRWGMTEAGWREGVLLGMGWREEDTNIMGQELWVDKTLWVLKSTGWVVTARMVWGNWRAWHEFGIDWSIFCRGELIGQRWVNTPRTSLCVLVVLETPSKNSLYYSCTSSLPWPFLIISKLLCREQNLNNFLKCH